MKKLFTFILLIAAVTSAFSQARRDCGTMEHLDILLQEDPAMELRMQQIEAFTRSIMEHGAAERAVDGVISIPVVVHVLYNVNRPEENISDAQIQSQIDVLNDDFRRLNADAANTLTQFVPVAADMEIEFCLASVDPDGNPTTGIERRSSTRNTWGTGTTMKRFAQGGLDAWPSDSYLNMWSCNIGGGILGFATFPGGAAANDGVVVGPNYFGSKDYDTNNDFYLSSPFDLGRTMTHEVGHWLNLRHIWGDGACGVDDFVEDTPRSDNSNYGCPLSHQSCTTLDMVQNYMDYTDDACMNIYTQGQKDRARAIFEPGGARAAMLNSAGCGIPEPQCLPVSGVTVEAGDNELTVSFNGAFYADFYDIEFAGPGEELQLIETIDDPAFGEISPITITIGSLESCTEYRLRISAICDNLNGYESTEVFTYSTTGVECVPPSCETPENLYAANITFTQATLGWDATEYAESYRVQGRLKGGLGIFTRTRTVDDNSFRTNALFPFLTYEFRVQSLCSADLGNSPYSGWYPFTLNPFLRESGLTVDDSGVEVVKLFETGSILQAYPNPTPGQVKLNYYGQDLDNVEMVVTDITGKELRSFDFNLVQSGSESVDLTDLQRGLYLLTFRKDGVILHTEKVMLAR